MTKNCIFKINYMKGGSNFPSYPNSFDFIRSHDFWPPKKNTHIIIKDKTYGDLGGTVISHIWNKTAAIIRLDNQNHPLAEASLINEPNFNNGKGHYLLLADHLWTTQEFSNQFNKDIVNSNDNMNNELLQSQNFNNTVHIDNTHNSYNNHNSVLNESSNIASIRSSNTNSYPVEDHMNYSSLSIDQSKFESENNKDLIMHSKPGSFIPNDHEGLTDNPLYSPLLTGSKKDYFSEKEIDLILSNTNKSVQTLSYDKIKILKKKLEHFEKISDNDIMIVINKNIAIDSLISNSEDEINEGNKVKIWIEKTLKKKLFPDLDVKIHSGYVYVTRTGIKVYDLISKELVPDLKYFKWQYDKPIDYHTLKYVIFQNSFQKNIQTNIIQKREAENILSQEYVIALQPDPYYLLWTFKRLIMLWYGDSDMEANIRKIKILINQFRGDPNQEYNKKHGILPQILIYPKYGVESARLVLSKINYYFTLYVDERISKSSKLVWKNSEPSHFLKKNHLIYYSNGSIDLKNYIKDSLIENSGFMNDIFSKNYSELLDAEQVMSV